SLRLPRPPTSTLFPYTTLFRSWSSKRRGSRKVSRRMRTLVVVDQRRKLVEPPSLRSIGVGRHQFLELVERGAIIVIVQKALGIRSEEHTSELQSPYDLVCRLLL